MCAVLARPQGYGSAGTVSGFRVVPAPLVRQNGAAGVGLKAHQRASTPVLLDDPAILTVEAAHSTGVAGETAVETVANSTIEAVDSSIDPAAAANRPPQEG